MIRALTAHRGGACLAAALTICVLLSPTARASGQERGAPASPWGPSPDLWHSAPEIAMVRVRNAGRAGEGGRLLPAQVRETTGPSWKVGAAVGAVVGAVGTYAVLHSGGSTSLCDRSRNQDAIDARECAGLTLLGAAAGAGLGVLAAKLLRTERWVPGPTDRIKLTIVPVFR